MEFHILLLFPLLPPGTTTPVTAQGAKRSLAAAENVLLLQLLLLRKWVYYVSIHSQNPLVDNITPQRLGEGEQDAGEEVEGGELRDGEAAVTIQHYKEVHVVRGGRRGEDHVGYGGGTVLGGSVRIVC